MGGGGTRSWDVGPSSHQRRDEAAQPISRHAGRGGGALVAAGRQRCAVDEESAAVARIPRRGHHRGALGVQQRGMVRTPPVAAVQARAYDFTYTRLRATVSQSGQQRCGRGVPQALPQRHLRAFPHASLPLRSPLHRSECITV